MTRAKLIYLADRACDDVDAAQRDHYVNCDLCAGDNTYSPCALGLVLDDAVCGARAYRACLRWLLGLDTVPPLAWAVEVQS